MPKERESIPQAGESHCDRAIVTTQRRSDTRQGRPKRNETIMTPSLHQVYIIITPRVSRASPVRSLHHTFW